MFINTDFFTGNHVLFLGMYEWPRECLGNMFKINVDPVKKKIRHVVIANERQSHGNNKGKSYSHECLKGRGKSSGLLICISFYFFSKPKDTCDRPSWVLATLGPPLLARLIKRPHRTGVWEATVRMSLCTSEQEEGKSNEFWALDRHLHFTIRGHCLKGQAERRKIWG